MLKISIAFPLTLSLIRGTYNHVGRFGKLVVCLTVALGVAASGDVTRRLRRPREPAPIAFCVMMRGA